MADGSHLEKSKNVVLMDIINSLLKTGNKAANINVKKYFNLYTLLTATDGKPQTSLKKAMLATLTSTFRQC